MLEINDKKFTKEMPLRDFKGMAESAIISNSGRKCSSERSNEENKTRSFIKG